MTSKEELRQIRLRMEARLAERPFVPHRWLPWGHLQTIAGSQQRREFDWGWTHAETDHVTVDGLCRIRYESVAGKGSEPALILIHGMSGSSRSGYMLGLSHKAFCRGWSSFRLDLYNRLRRLSRPPVFHAGSSHLLEAVLQEMQEKHGWRSGFLVGVSLGGNTLLKLLGEWGETPPDWVGGAAVISPLVDLDRSWPLLDARGSWLYRRYYLGRLRRIVQKDRDRLEGTIDFDRLARLATIREFDRVVTVPLSEHQSVEEYYREASAVRVLDSIRVPTLVLHSKDDPLLPWRPWTRPEAKSNPFLLLALTERGGHVAFIENPRSDRDRSWAENRSLEFLSICREEGRLLS